MSSTFDREIDLLVDKGKPEVTLRIAQRTFGSVDCVVWDAALAFSKFVEKNPSLLLSEQSDLGERGDQSRGQIRPFLRKVGPPPGIEPGTFGVPHYCPLRILELGAGTGICGLVCAAFGHNVTVTDLPHTLDLIRTNLAQNRALIRGTLVVEALDWCDKESVHRYVQDKGKPDVILIVDCVYYEASLFPLITTLQLLCNERTVVYCAYEERDIGKPKEIQAAFLNLVSKWMSLQKVPPDEQHPDYVAEDILLFRMIRKEDVSYQCEKMSIVIPVHNAQPWFQDCLHSCLNQTIFTAFPKVKIDISIFDDASSDGSEKVAESFAASLPEHLRDRLTVKITKSDRSTPGGVGFAKNRAIRAAASDQLVFLDADDVMKSNRLEELAKSIVENGPWTLYGSRFSREPPNSTRRYTDWANGLSQMQLFTQRFTSHGPTLVAPTWSCSRTLFDAVHGFNELEPCGSPEDMLFFFDALKLGCDLLAINCDLSTYRYHDKCASHSVKEETMWNVRLKEFERAVLPRWDRFTIWNAGKEGRRFYRSLSTENRQKVACFCDVSRKYIGQGFYEHALAECDPKPRVPIVHFKDAKPPFVICVKQGLTDGGLEQNIESLRIVEGVDFYHFG